ncbi:MAG: response regulator [Dehalococcoidia bacterium]|nr:response regulator [Dehalococcoidia bacterium]
MSSSGSPVSSLADGVKARTKASLFIIDDDRSLLRLLRLIFEDADFDVQAFPDAQVALAEIAQHEPDAIILDLEMPVMNGRDFYRAVREAGLQTPVLILSAYGARAAQIELGADAYVDKPFEPEQLIEAITRLLNRA